MEAGPAELLSPLLALVLGVCSDFSRDWESNDLRAAIFKLLLAWLLLSVTAIQLSWRKYGPTVNGLYYRHGMGGQNGGTPDYPAHYPMWASVSTESLKTHQE
ncbi:T-cell leukemia translocation-altered gene protein isoform X2 [Ranitomeya variabilis]|uniref:T-cell leukemia translocation-altered gene protein isoform X1 n=1 Tax=Ranitomeya variabilis TaxID=490064 RepID=UPI0040569D0E